MKLIIITFTLLVALMIIAFLYTWYRFRKSIYIHTTENQELLNKYPLEHIEVNLTTKDRLQISSWYIPVPHPKAVVILIPGFTDKNGGKALMLPHAAYLKDAGYSSMLLDLRSTGESSGAKSYLGIKEWQDVEAAYDYLKNQPENKDTKIGFFGISMGAATAIITTGKTGKGDFIIASVPYASFDGLFAFQLSKDHLPSVLLPLLKLAAAIEFGLSYNTYNPSRLIKNIHIPVFIIAAKQDKDVGYAGAADLYQLANKPKYFWAPNSQHDVHLEQPEKFQNRVLSFLEMLN
ncbi:MAG TPA: alpha/beta hydrolase [Patescibacteria group bacterium]|nr:alpha/beta hydrolase [Patescibacteria group bacterium]